MPIPIPRFTLLEEDDWTGQKTTDEDYGWFDPTGTGQSSRKLEVRPAPSVGVFKWSGEFPRPDEDQLPRKARAAVYMSFLARQLIELFSTALHRKKVYRPISRLPAKRRLPAFHDPRWAADALASEWYTRHATLLTTINASREIVRLRDNWDGEGATGYSYETWKRATDFLRSLMRLVLYETDAVYQVPRINPADQGSIDLFWKKAERELLINVPADADAPASYYGQDRYGNTTSGLIHTGSPPVALAGWLTQG